jgi:curli production assembly/transport component CsgG
MSLSRRLVTVLVLAGASVSAGACSRYEYTGSLGVNPSVGVFTKPGRALAEPPPPAAPINVAVYDFQDLTGQNKSSYTVGFAEFSRAITQGASVILVDALKTAGSGSWFNVVERGYLDSLLRERKLIQDTYSFLKKDPRKLIDPLKFAEYIVTGGVVSYDSPIQTGSAAVTLGNYGGGLGGHKDLVTINIRLVRVRDGLVLKSINASRPIITGSATGNATRVLGRRILDAKGAIGVQEATQTAVREAIEAGVYELVRSGAATWLWEGRTFSPYGPDVAQTGSIKLSTGARPARAASPAKDAPEPPAQAAKTLKAPDPGGPPQGAGTGATPPKPAQSAASAP